jgi:hypothetical protein
VLGDLQNLFFAAMELVRLDLFRLEMRMPQLLVKTHACSEGLFFLAILPLIKNYNL